MVALDLLAALSKVVDRVKCQMYRHDPTHALPTPLTRSSDAQERCDIGNVALHGELDRQSAIDRIGVAPGSEPPFYTSIDQVARIGSYLDLAISQNAFCPGSIDVNRV